MRKGRMFACAMAAAGLFGVSAHAQDFTNTPVGDNVININDVAFNGLVGGDQGETFTLAEFLNANFQASPMVGNEILVKATLSGTFGRESNETTAGGTLFLGAIEFGSSPFNNQFAGPVTPFSFDVTDIGMLNALVADFLDDGSVDMMYKVADGAQIPPPDINLGEVLLTIVTDGVRGGGNAIPAPAALPAGLALLGLMGLRRKAKKA